MKDLGQYHLERSKELGPLLLRWCLVGMEVGNQECEEVEIEGVYPSSHSSLVGASPSDVKAWITFLYWPASAARLARLALWTCWLLDSFGTFRRLSNFSPVILASAQRSAIPPDCHLLMRDFTNFTWSRQYRRLPFIGLNKMQRGNIKSLRQGGLGLEAQHISLIVYFRGPSG